MARFDEKILRFPAIEEEPYDEIESQGAGWKPTLWEVVPASAISGTIPAGEYYIGDLSHFMKYSIYDKLWGAKFNYENGIFKSSNNDYFAVGSTQGDTMLKGTNGFRYSCPSGTISILSKKLAKEKLLNYNENGTFHHIDKTIRILFDSDGFRFASPDWHLFIPLHK